MDLPADQMQRWLEEMTQDDDPGFLLEGTDEVGSFDMSSYSEEPGNYLEDSLDGFSGKSPRPEDEDFVPDLGTNLEKLEEMHGTFLEQEERSKKKLRRKKSENDDESD